MRRKGKIRVKEKVIGFALRAAGSVGVTFKEFALWLSPWGFRERDLSPLLRGMSEEGLAELTEDASGEILVVRLTDAGEREMASLSADR